MAMSVFERIHEIGIMRAVGWRKRRIALLILSEAIGIGLIALGVGLALGYLAAELFTSQGSLSALAEPDFTAGVFAWGLAFALGVALIGALYPAWRAVRLQADRGAAAGVAPAPSSTRPSRIRRVRSAAAATSSSFVTSRIVIPRSSRSRSRSSTICAPVAESSAPVGSSASRSLGSFASARAIATR